MYIIEARSLIGVGLVKICSVYAASTACIDGYDVSQHSEKVILVMLEL